MTRHRRWNRITVFENQRRAELLRKFAQLIHDYEAATVPPQGFGEIDPQETPASMAAREAMNRILHDVDEVMTLAGEPAIVQWTPPAMTGGFIQNIPLVLNYFQLHRYQIGPQIVLDHVVRAIGIYEADSSRARFRTFNPFFWLGLGLDIVAGWPFALARRTGFNTSKVEDSLPGRLIRLVVWSLGAVVLFLTFLQLIGFLDSFLQVLDIQMRDRPPLPPES